MEGTEAYPRNRRLIVALPTNDDKTLVAVQWPRAEFHAIRRNIAGNFMRALDELAPNFASRVRKGRQEERFIGTGDLPNFYRKSHGPGWALVGDAGLFKDPILGHGMSDAFESAELLAGAVDRGLSGKSSLEEALAEYERQRNEATESRYNYNCQRATLEPPAPEIQKLFYAMRGNQAAINYYLSINAGTNDPADFFTYENIQRITCCLTFQSSNAR